MSTFDDFEAIPEWVQECFDGKTALPFGPLSELPIPLEGQVTGGAASTPKDAPPCWQVKAESLDDVPATLSFYEEFLPLSGYRLVASGTLSPRKRFFTHLGASSAMVVFRREHYVGLISMRVRDEGSGTSITVTMGDPESAELRDAH